MSLSGRGVATQRVWKSVVPRIGPKIDNDVRGKQPHVSSDGLPQGPVDGFLLGRSRNPLQSVDYKKRGII